MKQRKAPGVAVVYNYTCVCVCICNYTSKYVCMIVCHTVRMFKHSNGSKTAGGSAGGSGGVTAAVGMVGRY